MSHRGDGKDHEARSKVDSSTTSFIYPIRSLFSGIQRPTLVDTRPRISADHVPTLQDADSPAMVSDEEIQKDASGLIINDIRAAGASSLGS
jgi:hypothetical protein